MKTLKLFPFLAMVTACIGLQADVLEMKNGQVFSGKYAGGTGDTINYQTAAGLQVLPTAQVTALTFTSPPPSPPPAPAPSASVTLPAGTTLLVRLLDAVSSQNGTGAMFSTRLEYDLPADGVVAVRGGAQIYGRVMKATQARRLFGQSTLDIRLTEIVVNGQSVPISTSGYEQASERSIAKAAKGAAAGAAIGAIAGNAGMGAAIGATAGALVRGKSITITPGTLLEFTLTFPVTFRATN